MIGDVEIPIGDANTLVDETGEPYWIKGEPDYKEKLGLSNIFGNWYYKGDHTSEYQLVLTLNEDGTYTLGNTEEGTYTCEEVANPGKTPSEKAPAPDNNTKKNNNSWIKIILVALVCFAAAITTTVIILKKKKKGAKQ